MSCCGSPTISTAPERISAAERRQVAGACAALLFEQTFAEVAKPLGFFGDLVVGAVAREIGAAPDNAVHAAFERALRATLP